MFYSPLRYPGGKTKLAKFVGQIIEKNKLIGGEYVEPYAGGAGVALYLLLNDKVSSIVINDADPVIYAFWWNVLYNTDSFIQEILQCNVNIDNWYLQKKILNDPSSSKEQLGFATFFLNRTNISGVIKGGCIGGIEQKGKYKIDARFNKTDLVERIRRIGEYRDSILLYNMDALDLLDHIRVDLTQSSLVYLDPPYYVKGSELYRNFYEHGDHAEIAKKVQTINTPWLVSYDNVEQIKMLYAEQEQLDFYLNYSTNKERRKGAEILIYNGINLPDNYKEYIHTAPAW
ncbi:DNA adenine methylase [Deferribacteres bacterium DY0037]